MSAPRKIRSFYIKNGGDARDFFFFFVFFLFFSAAAKTKGREENGACENNVFVDPRLSRGRHRFRHTDSTNRKVIRERTSFPSFFLLPLFLRFHEYLFSIVSFPKSVIYIFIVWIAKNMWEFLPIGRKNTQTKKVKKILFIDALLNSSRNNPTPLPY